MSSTIARAELMVVNPKAEVRWSDRASDCAISTTVLRLYDSDGVEGLAGFESYTYGAGDRTYLEAVRSMWPWLQGRNVDCQQDLINDLRVGVLFPFAAGPLGLVDAALWDLLAKREGKQLWQLLGGARSAVPAYASLPTMADEQTYADTVARAVESGYRAVKVHAFGDVAKDISLMTMLRSNHPNLTLMHDAEGVYTRQEALRVGMAFDELDCRWFEAPLPDFDLDGYRDLRRRLSTPVLPAGYALWDPMQIAYVLHDSPWSACRAELASSIGITAVTQIANLAASFGMDFEPVTYGHNLYAAAGLHVALGLRNVSYVEVAYPTDSWEYGVLNPIRPDSDGNVHAPDSAGIGLELDWDYLKSITSYSVTMGD